MSASAAIHQDEIYPSPTMNMNMNVPASVRTLAVAELVDMIAGHLPSEDLIAASQVCRILYIHLHESSTTRKRLLRAIQMKATRNNWKQVPFADRYNKTPNLCPAEPPGVDVEPFSPPPAPLTSLQWIWERLKRAREPSPPPPGLLMRPAWCSNTYCTGSCMLCRPQ
ncbi:uncharacterized protein MYCFIDRAFT_212237 [Pseudocercospora fijiensis CIRAD86]|uniref:F-box domain-containing protein n=1 Tax=Pseudocercospora fijiensis (strain CIRAD86) TaxID=383855 RepID=M3AQY8_PSEFD|nr:uncharacterized protein MYCFIDRAFT_212237 [Pseudocercospora fijiensis CIRAD86]EME79513.1 hypothetical protein MYCFIDRAFT_212237 [Pseudocercospora fijiensis CIRAD86]